MRLVHKPRQVAHLWATGGQDYARVASHNFYFSGDTIFSYGSHFPIARLIVGGVLFTSRGYSQTTAKHISYVRRALSDAQLAATLYVHNPAADSPAEHADNYRRMRDSAQAIAYRLTIKGVRSTTKAKLAASYAKLRERSTRYRSQFCKGALRECPLIPELPATLLAAVKAAETKAAKAEAKRLREAAECESAHLAAWYSHGLAAWKRGESYAWQWGNRTSDGWTGPPSSAPINFRLRDDVRSIRDGQIADSTVQTTRGAEFPRSHCERVFRAILRCRQSGQAWQRNGDRIPVGLFQVDSIDAQGNVVAGCHNVRWEEIESFARELGLIAADAPPIPCGWELADTTTPQ